MQTGPMRLESFQGAGYFCFHRDHVLSEGSFLSFQPWSPFLSQFIRPPNSVFSLVGFLRHSSGPRYFLPKLGFSYPNRSTSLLAWFLLTRSADLCCPNIVLCTYFTSPFGLRNPFSPPRPPAQQFPPAHRRHNSIDTTLILNPLGSTCSPPFISTTST